MTEQIEEATLRVEASSRGGGIEIDLTSFGFPGERMTAYQNYLGGGMLGTVQTDCTVSEYGLVPELVEIAKALAEYFHNITNPEDDEWSGSSFKENQYRPASAY